MVSESDVLKANFIDLSKRINIDFSVNCEAFVNYLDHCTKGIRG